MQWAWKQNVVKQVSDIGTKLAISHTIAWGHYRNKVFTEDSGYKNRLRVAKQAVRI